MLVQLGDGEIERRLAIKGRRGQSRPMRTPSWLPATGTGGDRSPVKLLDLAHSRRISGINAL